jgi:hypothetical protein
MGRGGETDRLIFEDGFESGDVTAWTSLTDAESDASVTEAAALVGTYGMQFVIDNTTAMYLVDATPDSEKRFRFRFYFDPNSVTMEAGNLFNMFVAQFGGANAIVITLEFNDGVYKIRPSSRIDAGTYTFHDRVILTDAPHYIEMDWKASSAAGANNGYSTLWVDGEEKTTMSSLDNDTVSITGVILGPSSGIDAGTSGTIFYDAYSSHTLDYIGAENP